MASEERMINARKWQQIFASVGIYKTIEECLEMKIEAERHSAILESLRNRIDADHKKHIQVLYRGIKRVGDCRCIVIKFNYLDSPKYWEYAERLLQDYCETIQEIKRTKTTLVVVAS